MSGIHIKRNKQQTFFQDKALPIFKYDDNDNDNDEFNKNSNNISCMTFFNVWIHWT